jgi:hypothetical protein
MMRLTAMRLALGAMLLAGPAAAAVHVHSPIVEEGEWELETRFDRTNDRSPTKDNEYSYNVSIAYGVTSWWKTELEAQWKRDPGGRLQYDSTSFENTFQLTPQGQYWVDVGIFAEYESVVQKGDHDSFTFGPLIQKEFGINLTTLNLLLTHELGRGSATGFAVEMRAQSVWRIFPWLAPGIEAYWEPGNVGNFRGAAKERLRSGPVVVGGLRLGGLGKLKYELGYLFGLGRASERGTIRGLLELELHF